MSAAQEQRKARLWDEVFEPEFNQRAEALREYKTKMEGFAEGSAEREEMQRIYDRDSESLLEFGMKHHESYP